MSTAVVDRFREWARGAPLPRGEVMERPHVDERLRDVSVSEHYVTFWLEDGRIISVPLSWSWRLQEATEAERSEVEISPYGAHWPTLDEDLSVRGALRGTPAPRPGSREGLRREEPQNAEISAWDAPRIKALRRRLGLTQEEMGERMGVRQATISDWEQGKQQPSPMARRLLDLLEERAD